MLLLQDCKKLHAANALPHGPAQRRTLSAATTAAPELIPVSRPSVVASLRAISTDSSLDT
jgi:hypothetical protein